MVEESVGQKILRQIEYYFGDINLPRDKFLQEEMKKDDGWIDLTTMLKFNRLNQLSQDIKQISNALESSELIEVSEDKAKIRRSQQYPLPDNTLEYWQEIKRRTVYVKGFDQNTKLDEIQDFLAPFGEIKNIVMRRIKKDDRTFKGSIFATFVDRDTADKFIKNEKSNIYQDKPLIKQFQDQYAEEKQKRSREQRIADKQAKQAKKLEQLVEQEKLSKQAKYEKGAILEINGLDPESTNFNELKTFFKQFGPVAFVAYEQGNETARIRFSGSTENAAKDAWETALKAGNDKVVFNEKELTGNVLEGEEEEKYWSEFTKDKVSKMGQGWGGKGGNRKNKRRHGGEDRDFGAKKSKHVKFNDDGDTAEEQPPVEEANNE